MREPVGSPLNKSCIPCVDVSACLSRHGFSLSVESLDSTLEVVQGMHTSTSSSACLPMWCEVLCRLGLPLGLETLVMTPNGVTSLLCAGRGERPSGAAEGGCGGASPSGNCLPACAQISFHGVTCSASCNPQQLGFEHPTPCILLWP